MINFVTGLAYTGVNAEELVAAGFADPRFMTFNQARKNGRKVLKGATGIRLVRVVEVEERNKKTGEIEKVKKPKYFTVFNVEQTAEVL